MENANLMCLSTHLKHSSPYYFGHDIVAAFPKELKRYDFDKVFFVSSDSVHRLHGCEVVSTLRDARVTCEELLVPEGEVSKNMRALDELCATLIEKRVSKDSILIGCGGGMIGNLVGMAAALIYRGIRFVELPTTLMAQSDSTLSNKQAVNGKNGKNQLGMYHAPIMIWGDTKYLATEPPRFIRAALVEGLKNAFISDPELLQDFSKHIHGNGQYTKTELHDLCYLIIRSKLPILLRDPTEKGYALILEYGHTFGHAIEWLTQGRVVHGEAVATGMCIAAELSQRLGYLSKDDVALHYRTLRDLLGVPIGIPPGLAVDDIIEAIRFDNKRVLEGVKYVVLERLGKCCQENGAYQIAVDPALVRDAIAALLPRESASDARRLHRPSVSV